MSFTHLQVRSGYSFLNSTITIDKMIKKVSELGFQAIALTDEEVLYGTIPFYKACLAHHIKPLIGMTIHLNTTTDATEECILLAKNNNGFKQLSRISTIIQKGETSGIEMDVLSQYTDDLLCILPISTSRLASLLENSSHEQATSYTRKWSKMFKEGDFYIGLGHHGLPNERQLLESAKLFQRNIQIPVVAINDVRYINEQDNIAYDCLRAIK